MEIVIGSYEGLVLAYKATQSSKSEDKWKLSLDFAEKYHLSSVKSLGSAESQFVASGSSDETVSVFDIEKRRLVTVLQQHSATVTCIRFWGKSFCLTSDENGKIYVWNRAWSVLGEFPGHVGAVTCLAVHPSGKLALSVGRDKTLRTWNLVTGRTAYITNVKAVPHLVAYSGDGGYYAVAVESKVNVYETKSAGIVQSFEGGSGRKVGGMEFVGNELAFCADSEVVEFWRVGEGKKGKGRSLVCHEPRVKAFDFCHKGPAEIYMATCGSSGDIKLWRYSSTRLPFLLTEITARFRPTCISILLSETSQQAQKTPGKAEEEVPHAEVEDEEDFEETSDDEEKVEIRKPGKNKSGLKGVDKAKHRRKTSLMSTRKLLRWKFSGSAKIRRRKVGRTRKNTG